MNPWKVVGIVALVILVMLAVAGAIAIFLFVSCVVMLSGGKL